MAWITPSRLIGAGLYALVAAPVLSLGPAGFPLSKALLWAMGLSAAGLVAAAITAPWRAQVRPSYHPNTFYWYWPYTWGQAAVFRRSHPSSGVRLIGREFRSARSSPASSISPLLFPNPPEPPGGQVTHTGSQFIPSSTSNRRATHMKSSFIPSTPTPTPTRATVASAPGAVTPTSSTFLPSGGVRGVPGQVKRTDSAFIPKPAATPGTVHTGTQFIPRSAGSAATGPGVSHTGSTFVPKKKTP